MGAAKAKQDFRQLGLQSPRIVLFVSKCLLTWIHKTPLPPGMEPEPVWARSSRWAKERDAKRAAQQARLSQVLDAECTFAPRIVRGRRASMTAAVTQRTQHAATWAAVLSEPSSPDAKAAVPAFSPPKVAPLALPLTHQHQHLAASGIAAADAQFSSTRSAVTHGSATAHSRPPILLSGTGNGGAAVAAFARTAVAPPAFTGLRERGTIDEHARSPSQERVRPQTQQPRSPMRAVAEAELPPSATATLHMSARPPPPPGQPPSHALRKGAPSVVENFPRLSELRDVRALARSFEAQIADLRAGFAAQAEALGAAMNAAMQSTPGEAGAPANASAALALAAVNAYRDLNAQFVATEAARSRLFVSEAVMRSDLARACAYIDESRAAASRDIGAARKAVHEAREDAAALCAQIFHERTQAAASMERLRAERSAACAAIVHDATAAAATVAMGAGISQILSPRRGTRVDVRAVAGAVAPAHGAEADGGGPLADYADVLDGLAAEVSSLRAQVSAHAAERESLVSERDSLRAERAALAQQLEDDVAAMLQSMLGVLGARRGAATSGTRHNFLTTAAPSLPLSTETRTAKERLAGELELLGATCEALACDVPVFHEREDLLTAALRRAGITPPALPPLPVLPEALRELPVFANRNESAAATAVAAAASALAATVASSAARLGPEQKQHAVNSSEGAEPGAALLPRAPPLSMPARAPPAPPTGESGGGPSRRAPPAPPSVLAAAPPHLQGVLREYLDECERREEAVNSRVF
jgi:hypothetical protein